MIPVNNQAPIQVVVYNQSGEEKKLEEYLGKWVLLYFYPKNNTPGCTKEACDFRDYNEEIKKLGVEIVGVSKDSVKSHLKFQSKHKLNFELWSDESLNLHKAFGVWVEKSMFGKKYMGAERSTFVINPEGKIVKIWSKVNPLGHAKDVYKYLLEER